MSFRIDIADPVKYKCIAALCCSAIHYFLHWRQRDTVNYFLTNETKFSITFSRIVSDANLVVRTCLLLPALAEPLITFLFILINNNTFYVKALNWFLF